MAFMKVSTNEEVIKDYTGGGNYLDSSGIYEIIIKSAIVETSAKGSQSITLWIDYNGQEQPIFQAMRLTNNDGSDNLGKGLFHKLCIVGGASDNDEIPDPVDRMVPIGKKGTEKECSVLETFDDMPLFIRLQMEYGMYEGEIQERKNIRNFFRYEDKATASEIVNNTDFGKQFLIESEEYSSKDTYKDGLTEEDIIEWKKNRRFKPKDEPKKPSGGFGGKRFGNKS